MYQPFSRICTSRSISENVWNHCCCQLWRLLVTSFQHMWNWSQSALRSKRNTQSSLKSDVKKWNISIVIFCCSLRDWYSFTVPLDVYISFDVETPNGQMVWSCSTAVLYIHINIYIHMTYHIQGHLQPIVADCNHTVTSQRFLPCINHPAPFAQQRLSSASSTCSSTE